MRFFRIFSLFFVTNAVLLFAGIEKPNNHGMVIFGQEKIYASHLPMFHLAHRYQTLMEISFPKEVEELYRNDKAKNPETFYTIAPEENFVLPDQVLQMKPFKVTLVRGHFEQGGTEIKKAVPVTIKRVVHHHQFKSTDSEGRGPFEYLLFGNAKEQFLAHWIGSAPSFDDIFSVTASNAFTETALQTGIVVRTAKRLQNKDVEEATLEDFAPASKVKITVNKVEYPDQKELLK